MRLTLIGIIAVCMLTGCQSAVQSAYFSMWEKLGVEKRDILVDRVEDAQESQQDAQEEFADALEEFSALINFEGGELEDTYQTLKSRYDASEKAAQDVSERIEQVDKVAQALFDEWQTELELIANQSLKRDSQSKLRQTQQKYQRLLRAMRAAESRMPPVLNALRDNVVYLKHNLNANAIGALQGELTSIKSDVNRLIAEMNSAIKESDAFIGSIDR